jgi:hypothetical protein
MDTSSEEWRHLCEVRAVLDMPVGRRNAYFELVAKMRGKHDPEAAQRLRRDVYRTWIARQVDGLMGMPPAARGLRLAKIESSSNKRTRGDVESALDRRMAANDNLEEERHADRRLAETN